MLAQQVSHRKATTSPMGRQAAAPTGPRRQFVVRLNRHQADIVVPGAWLTVLLSVAFFARPVIIPAAVISTLVLGLYYAARDAAGDE